MGLLKEQEKICRESGDPELITNSLVAQGLLLADGGELQEALNILEDAQRLASDSKLTDHLVQIEKFRHLILEKSKAH